MTDTLNFYPINNESSFVIKVRPEIITNEDYKNKVYVVEFFFTTCPTICPKMNYNLIQVQNYFKDYKEDFGVASFTINPANDTIEVLKAYADKYGVTNPNWHLMTGDRDAIYELANQGFNIYVGQNDEAEGGFEAYAAKTYRVKLSLIRLTEPA